MQLCHMKVKTIVCKMLKTDARKNKVVVFDRKDVILRELQETKGEIVINFEFEKCNTECGRKVVSVRYT